MKDLILAIHKYGEKRVARLAKNWVPHEPTKKSTSQGKGGRGRSTKIGMSTMNKNKRRSYKKYRGQGKRR